MYCFLTLRNVVALFSSIKRLCFLDADIDAPHAEETHSASDWTTHMVRGTWLSKSKEPPSCGLPSPLLYHLRSIIEDDGNQLPPSPSTRVVSLYSTSHDLPQDSCITDNKLYETQTLVDKLSFHSNILPVQEIERAVIETIISIFNPMMESLSHTDDFDR